jgi:hypothetical protein
MNWARLVVAAVVLMFLCAAGPDPPAKRYTFRTKRYTVSTDVPRELADEIGAHMDAVAAEYERRFASFPATSRKTFRLYVFRKQETYLRFLESCDVDGRNTSGMCFVTNEGEGLATYTEGNDRRGMYITLQHEGFHQFAYQRIARQLPPWVNEGLAEYFGAAYLVKGKLVIGGADAGRAARLKSAVKEGGPMPVQSLMEMSNETWLGRVNDGKGGGTMQYDQAWALVSFLIEADSGKYLERFEQYLHHLSKGLKHRQAYMKAFGLDKPEYKDLGARWKEWVEQLEPDPVNTAAMRVAFLARGLKLLHRQGVKVESMDDLKKGLRAGNFRSRWPGHGQVVEMSSSDDEVFEAPAGGTVELVPSVDEELPATVVVKGLKAPVRVQWKVEDGEVMGEIVYE